MGTLLIDFAVNTALMLALAWLITRPAFMRRNLAAALRRLADDIERDQWPVRIRRQAVAGRALR